ncbi:hypothetical protein HanPSC8_Chr06g0245221 [Helianthus annuus]|nr:hypothetical protein HanPSC8_Chr06g0245221 [Helianthus annuus]
MATILACNYSYSALLLSLLMDPFGSCQAYPMCNVGPQSSG